MFTENKTLWPNGIAGFADYLHSKDLQLGCYTSPATKNCCGEPGSLGFENVDMEFFAQVGCDHVMVDWCRGYSSPLETKLEYVGFEYPIAPRHQFTAKIIIITIIIIIINIIIIIIIIIVVVVVVVISRSRALSLSLASRSPATTTINTDVNVLYFVYFYDVINNSQVREDRGCHCKQQQSEHALRHLARRFRYV